MTVWCDGGIHKEARIVPKIEPITMQERHVGCDCGEGRRKEAEAAQTERPD